MSSMTTTCPLCERGCKSYDHIREHLHVNHRKSEIIDSYLEGVAPDRERVVVEAE